MGLRGEDCKTGLSHSNCRALWQIAASEALLKGPLRLNGVTSTLCAHIGLSLAILPTLGDEILSRKQPLKSVQASAGANVGGGNWGGGATGKLGPFFITDPAWFSHAR